MPKEGHKDTSGNAHTGSYAPRKAKRGGGGAKASSNNKSTRKTAPKSQY